ncbi:MAG: LGFP repeat-containing protein, partial [Microbacteriaceae bacterium]
GAYRTAGYQNGALGYPTNNAIVRSDGSMVQDFQGGSIIYNPDTGTEVLLKSSQKRELALPRTTEAEDGIPDSPSIEPGPEREGKDEQKKKNDDSELVPSEELPEAESE